MIGRGRTAPQLRRFDPHVGAGSRASYGRRSKRTDLWTKVGRAEAMVSMVLFSAPADVVSMLMAGSTLLAVMLWFPAASGPSA